MDEPSLIVTQASLFRDLVTVTVTDTHGVQGGVSHGHQGRGGGGPGPGILSLEEAEAEPKDHEAAVNSPHHEAGHWVAVNRNVRLHSNEYSSLQPVPINLTWPGLNQCQHHKNYCTSRL